MQTKLAASGCVALLASMFLAPCAPAEDLFARDAGRRFPPEKRTLKDAKTGATITALTTDPANDQKIYQTHPQWTSDGAYIIFRSNRPGKGRQQQAFALREETGEIIQLTEGRTGTGSLNVGRKSNRLYFFRGGRAEAPKLIELELDGLLRDSLAGSMKDPPGYERAIMTMPQGMGGSGGFSLDADEKKAYIGVAISGQDGGGIRSIDLETGEIATVIDVPFRMGHVQANPWVPGEILYCDETGGDAPQRMWLVKADGTDNHALYKETPDEWVTHEVFVDRDHVMFNVMGHLPRFRTKPTGIFCINVRTDQVQVVGQVEEGRGFWHCAGSADGKWAAGDNFAGSIHLINRITGETTLLTTGHQMQPDHAHPNFSPDGKRILFQSGLLSGGRSLDLMTVELPAARGPL